MHPILDNINRIHELDKSNMLGSIESLGKQCEQAALDLKGLNLPKHYQNVKNIVVCGMGGSALGAHIIDSLYFDQLGMPLEIVNDYHLPSYAGKDSLVLLCSYSGATEETVSCAAEAKKPGARLLVVTNGADLGKFMAKNKIPGYHFQPNYNPCHQPRMGLGYTLFSIFLLLGKAGLIKFGDSELNKVLKTIDKYNRGFGIHILSEHNKAKQIAEQLLGKIPFYYSSGFLAGNIHAAMNQLNENAKAFGAWFLIPEMNHHLMEGLRHPLDLKDHATFVFFESQLFDPKIQKRFEVTKNVVEKSGVPYLTYQMQDATKLGQSFELLVLGSYISYYLAMLYGIDPSPIPMVDYFKEQLKD